MSSDASKVTEAAMAVMRALENLSAEDCARVLESAASLFNVRLKIPRGQSPDEIESASEPELPSKRRSLAEFIKDVSPATNAQRIASFAHCREHVEKKPNFARADLEPYFAMAKVSAPGNYDRDFNAAVKEGWIHENGDSSYLTTSGEAAIAAGFGGKGKPRGRAVAKKSRKKAAASE